MIQNAVNFVQAQFSGKRVSLEIAQERFEICQRCAHSRKANDQVYCGIGCGCPTRPKQHFIKALSEVEENLPKWGCKHPLRSRGKGWKR